MAKTYTVDVSVHSSGHTFHIRTSDGEDKWFSDNQLKTIRTSSGMKQKVKVTPNARIRSDAYIAELEAQGYTRELKGIEKDFAEMRELMDELGYTREERAAAVSGFVAAAPTEGRKTTPQERYHKAKTTTLSIRLMLNTEQDIIAKLDEVPNKAGYLKRLIREDIEREKNGK